MPTKDELLTFAQEHGIDADISMLKADLEAAISAAGYDPATLEEPMSDEPGTEVRASRDARFSTYREATPAELDNADEKLPPGRHVVQERGEASERGGTTFSANR